jgi:hypothetical protein
MVEDLIKRLKEAAQAATAQNLDTAQQVERFEDGSHITCPTCGGEGYAELNSDFCNYDGKAIGVQFYGIGPEHSAAEAYFRAASPAAILELIAMIEQQVARLTALESERDALLAAAGKEAVAGWKLVPVELTPEMVKAGSNSGGLGMQFHEWMGRITVAWRHMLDAAPTAALEKGDGRDAERGHWNPVYNTDPVQRACGELPEGWEIQILLERDAGCVYLIDPNGERSDIDNADKFDWTIHEAIDAALSQQKEVRDET